MTRAEIDAEVAALARSLEYSYTHPSEGAVSDPKDPRPYCPDCEPDADPLAELLETRYCGTHWPKTPGADDALVSFALTPGTDAEQSRGLCAFVHRNRPAR